jgi:sulfatase modifying factor 1
MHRLSAFARLLSTLCLALALASCLTSKQETQPKEICLLNGSEIDCDILRNLPDPNSIPTDTAAIRKQDSIKAVQDSLKRARDSISFAEAKAKMVYVLPLERPGTLVAIPSGTLRRADGKTVTVKSFLLSNTEFTAGEKAGATGVAGSGADAKPATIMWVQAIRLCNKLSMKDGLDSVYVLPVDTAGKEVWDSLKVDYRKNGYRLPNEAEWEYAALGSTDGKFYWGESAEDSLVRNYAWGRFNCNGPQEVAGRVANSFGLFDMFGNVWEYVNDTRTDYSLPETPPTEYPDPGSDYPALSAGRENCLVKGGSFESIGGAQFPSAQYRWAVAKTIESTRFGMRLARSRPPDGEVTDLYPDGRIRSQREYRDGKIVGTRKTWLDSGYTLEENFTNGVKSGESLWDSTGLLIVFEYYSENLKKSRTEYRMEGGTPIKDGTYRYWATNGQLLSIELWKDGLLQGVSRQYNENGTNRQLLTYEKGVLNGTVRWWDDGHPKTLYTYVNGKREGIGYGWLDGRDSAAPPDNETLYEGDSAHIVVDIGYRTDGKTPSVKSAQRRGYDYLYYDSTGWIEANYSRLIHPSDQITVPAYARWYASGAVKEIHNPKKPPSTRLEYLVTFSEDGACLTNCDKLGPAFKVEAYRRPDNLEYLFHTNGYVGFPDNLTGILAE